MKITPEMPRIPPRVGLFLGILAASSAAILIRFAQLEASSLVIAAARLGLASIVLAVLVIPGQRSELKSLNRTQLGLMVLSGFFLALHFATWITSLQYTSVASSVVLVTTTPLWVALLSPLFLKEKITRYVGAGLVVALAGSLVIGASEACVFTSAGFQCQELVEILKGKGLLGDILALAGAWFAAFYLLVGRKVRGEISLKSYTLIVYGTAAVVLLSMAAGFRLPFTGFSWQTYLFLLLLAIIPQLIGHSLFNWALKFVSATFVSIALLGEPIGSSILALVILGEPPTPLELVGGALIILGIVIASWHGREKIASAD